LSYHTATMESAHIIVMHSVFLSLNGSDTLLCVWGHFWIEINYVFHSKCESISCSIRKWLWSYAGFDLQDNDFMTIAEGAVSLRGLMRLALRGKQWYIFNDYY
jgi:hypothetical protein